MSNEITKRMDYIDSIKGFAIFLVVMGHAIAWLFEDFYSVLESDEMIPLFWWKLIYAFHMPLFMFVSGYLFPRRFTGFKDLQRYLFRKVYTLAIPYIVCSGLLEILLGGAIIGFLKQCL